MVEVKDITFSYGKSGKHVLDRVGFSLENGSCMAILGTNGAGKSTLLRCIDRILHPKHGQVLVDGCDVFRMSGKEMAKNIAYVAQNGGSMDMTVFDAVLLGRKPYIQWDVTQEDRQIVSDVLQKLHLEEYAMRNMAELSGGEVQKILLARALAQEPKVLLLDEPTSNLDPKNQHQVLEIVRDIAQERNICVIMVLHDLNLAIRYCDRFLFLKDSDVYADGGMEVMNPEIIEEVYGIHVHIVPYMDIPVLVPFPHVKPTVVTLQENK